MNVLYLGVGCGGEPKFLCYDDCFWDYLLDSIELLWQQKKNYNHKQMQR